ncbi:DUF1877 family protein [Actinocorallia sp. A-T 12471]|uniref:DUF1877 family protein n=1 Tax=Actinocorallia sp. A-T 12471 TaxID=3089813 RepID=UPI0029CFEC7B|nr:DUF1877 family protein [Actinocorallia sp. A-T 12471]MDX6740729.1 DUF1877 family protein [Actinocorallia sp. A-T 12471]
MNGRYARITARKLGAAIVDGTWARGYVDALEEAEDEAPPPPARARTLSVGWAWQALAFLLARAAFPVDLVHGGKEFGGAEWGYGPPRYLEPDEVALAARAVGETSFAALTDGVAPADLAAADLYPSGKWSSPDALFEVQAFYEPLHLFVRAAAREREAVLLWIELRRGVAEGDGTDTGILLLQGGGNSHR